MIAVSSIEEPTQLNEERRALLGVLRSISNIPEEAKAGIKGSLSYRALLVARVPVQWIRFHIEADFIVVGSRPNARQCQAIGNTNWIQRRLLNRSASKRTRMLSRIVKAIMLLPP